MAVGDEPDFGFLDNDQSDSDPNPHQNEQYTFADPTEQAAPATEPESASNQGNSSKASSENASPAEGRTEQSRRLRRPAKKAAVSSTSEQAAGQSSKAAVQGRKAKVKQTATPSQPVPAGTALPPNTATRPNTATPPNTAARPDTVPKSQFYAVVVFAAVLSIALLLQMLGMINLAASHQLESVPDVAPLKEGEFQLVPDTASLPTGHELKLGQEARFGEIIFTPTKVVREPLSFVQMTTGQPAIDLKTQDVLKLYFTVKNVSDLMSFSPWDLQLMTHRSPSEGLDESTKANSWLRVSDGQKTARILNYFHSPNSNFNIVDLLSRVPLKPDESRSMFVASSEEFDDWLPSSADLRWRLQVRKGVHLESKHSVTTFVDVCFSESDIQL